MEDVRASVVSLFKISWYLHAGMRKITKHSQDSRSSGRDLSPGALKYEAGVLPLDHGAYVIIIEQVSSAKTHLAHV